MYKKLALSLLLFATAAFADDIVAVTVNTSSLNGAAGYVDYQFNPSAAKPGSLAAQVVVNSTLPGTNFYQQGGVTTPPLTLTNSSSVNEYTSAVTFGKSFTLTLDFSGLAVTNPNPTFLPSDFFLSVLDSNGNGVLNNNPNAATADIRLSQDTGKLVLSSNSPDVAFNVPEPGSLALFGGGLVALFAWSRRKRA